MTAWLYWSGQADVPGSGRFQTPLKNVGRVETAYAGGSTISMLRLGKKFRWFGFVVLIGIGLISTTPVFAVNCATQAQMSPADRNALANAARQMMSQVQTGDVNSLKSMTLPAVAADFSGIANSVQNLAPAVLNATVTVDALYDLDASDLTAGATSTQFFCGSPVVVLTFSNLPAGHYALALLHATGVKNPQQVSLILAQDASKRWLLAGFFAKPMVEGGHDGLWYWISARKYAQANGKWAAWFYYKLAAGLLQPLDNLSSPNLQKLQQETEQAKPQNLPAGNPVMLTGAGGAFQLTAIDTTTQFGGLDLDVHYTPSATQAAELRNPPTARKQVTDVMAALLAQHPELHGAFHGIWVHADQGDASLFALELPMEQIASTAGSTSAPTIR